MLGASQYTGRATGYPDRRKSVFPSHPVRSAFISFWVILAMKDFPLAKIEKMINFGIVCMMAYKIGFIILKMLLNLHDIIPL